MADRLFERLLNQASASATAAAEAADPAARQEKRQRTEEEELRKLSTGMTAADAIKRILLAYKDKDYFRLLELPPPEVDALGRPAWDQGPAAISKAYRRLSVLVHPDKNPGEEARQAFEALNEAHRMLKDQGKLEEILKAELERARARRDEAESRATLEERMALNAQRAQQAKELQKKEGASFQAEILRQMREKQEAAKRKRQLKSRYRRDGSDEEQGGSDGEQQQQQQQQQQQNGGGGAGKQGRGRTGEGSSDDDEDPDSQHRRQALAKRRQQRRPSGV